MRTRADLEALVDASLGNARLDLIVRGGTFLDVHRAMWTRGDIGISRGRIVRLGEDLEGADVIDVGGRYVVPGFFDPHFHAGGCHLSPTKLAEALLARGTTSTVCDFQEHYVVAGTEAARFALEEARRAGLRVFYLVPIHMFVVGHLGVSGQGMRVDDMLEMLEWPETVAINEPPPGPVLGKNADALTVISRALEKAKIYSGHAPEFSGRALQGYVSTGASSDHESTRASDAWMKLGLGMKVIMREGSAAPDMLNLLELARDHPYATRHMMLGTDEIDPLDLFEHGHMDHKIRLAISNGLDVITAYQMATLNPAEYYRLDHEIGSITPGRFADLVVVTNPEKVDVELVFAQGRPLHPDVRVPDAVDYPELVLSRVRLDRDLDADDFRMPYSGREASVRVVGIEDGSLVSQASVMRVTAIRGSLNADPSRDLLKMAMIERYSGTGEAGLAFVKGFGFGEGAVATTYAHPFYNVLVVGADDSSMALAVNRLREIGGGLTVARAGNIVHEWQLPIVGIFSTESLGAVKERFEATNTALRELGCPLESPVLTLSFAALVTIPEYGLTSKGLYHVNDEEFVPVIMEEAR